MAQQNDQNFHGDAYGVAGNVEGDQITNVFPPARRSESTGIPSNLPRTTSLFVGREKDLERLEQKLQQDKQVAIAAVAGMGGVGKSALALNYAQMHLEDYPGGVCWLRVRGQELTSQIVGFAQAELGLKTPEGLEGGPLVRWCWSHWQEGQVLLIFDDVAEEETIKPYLPPLDDRFRVVATTRERWRGMQRLDLDVLDEDSSLKLLRDLIGVGRIDGQIEDAHELCSRLGYLPLALELVGGFLGEEEFWSLRQVLDELEALGLTQDALVEAGEFMTAQLGVSAAFELSWVRLPELAERAQELGCLLSGFGAAPVPWPFVEMATGEEKSKPLKQARKVLKKLNFVQEVAEEYYQLHPLMREFLRQKLHERGDSEAIEKNVAGVLVNLAKQVPQALTIEQVPLFGVVVPHWEHTVRELLGLIEETNLVGIYLGLGRFFSGQGLYEVAVSWLEECKEKAQELLGDKYPYVATILHNLALLYGLQGRYEQAEPLYAQALELYQQLLGDEHPYVATSINNLALLYRSQGRYEKAEPLLIQALELRQKLLGDKHPSVAASLNNLASLYRSQDRYEQAELLYAEAIELNQELLGDKHPNVATSLNNLAFLYHSQGHYEQADPLYVHAFVLRKELLGDKHPNTIATQNNLEYLRFEMQIHQLISNPQFQPFLEAWNAPTETKTFMEQLNSDPQLQQNVQEFFQNLQQ